MFQARDIHSRNDFADDVALDGCDPSHDALHDAPFYGCLLNTGVSH